MKAACDLTTVDGVLIACGAISRIHTHGEPLKFANPEPVTAFGLIDATGIELVAQRRPSRNRRSWSLSLYWKGPLFYADIEDGDTFKISTFKRGVWESRVLGWANPARRIAFPYPRGACEWNQKETAS